MNVELAIFEKQVIDDINDLHKVLNAAKRKSLKISQKLHEEADARMLYRKKIRESAEYAGCVHMYLCEEIEDHLREVANIIANLDE